MSESACPVRDSEVVEDPGSPNRKAPSRCTLLVLARRLRCRWWCGRCVACGSGLLADMADRNTLTAQLSGCVRRAHGPADGTRSGSGADGSGDDDRRRRRVHQRHLDVSDQPDAFGPVASDSTCSRLLDAVTDATWPLSRLHALLPARSRGLSTPRPPVLRCLPRWWPASRCSIRMVGGLVIDEDATLVIAHSEKEQAAATFKHLRVPSGAGVLRQHQRGVDRNAAAGRRRLQHRRRPHHSNQRRAGTDPRPSTGTGIRSCSASTGPAPPRRCWHTCVACASRAWPASSQSAGRSPRVSTPRSPR